MSQDPSRLVWRKSRRSHQNGECVEIAQAPGTITVRDSKNPTGPTLTFQHSTFRTFFAEIRKGQHFTP